MFTKYVEEEETYLITNKLVARTSIFGSRFYCERFLYQLRKYVGPLGKILAYALVDDEFSFIVQLDDRKAFKEYYVGRQLNEGKEVGVIPDSTYIFSRAMANLQSSTALNFNHREDRSGAFFASRFKKRKLSDQVDLRLVLQQLWKSIQVRTYRKRWRAGSISGIGDRKSWWFNFQGLVRQFRDLRFWKEMEAGDGMLGSWKHSWVGEMEAAFQGQLMKTRFFTQLAFNLPFIKTKSPP